MSYEVIEAFVACGGRIHLYDHLDKVGERDPYCEIDSVIFVQKEGRSLLVTLWET